MKKKKKEKKNLIGNHEDLSSDPKIKVRHVTNMFLVSAATVRWNMETRESLETQKPTYKTENNNEKVILKNPSSKVEGQRLSLKMIFSAHVPWYVHTHIHA